jgi:hypothetical protein
MLRRKFGTKIGEVTGGWRKVCSVELHVSYYSPQLKKNEIGGSYGMHCREMHTVFWCETLRDLGHP